MGIPQWGALAFGLVIGWILYRTLRHNTTPGDLNNISAVIGAVGGAAVTGMFKAEDLFGAYCIGLAVGFFLYLLLGATIFKNVKWVLTH